MHESKVNYDQFNNRIKHFPKINFNTTPVLVKEFLQNVFVLIFLKDTMNTSYCKSYMRIKNFPYR